MMQLAALPIPFGLSRLLVVVADDDLQPKIYIQCNFGKTSFTQILYVADIVTEILRFSVLHTSFRICSTSSAAVPKISVLCLANACKLDEMESPVA